MAVSVRHTVLSLRKREHWYEDIRPSAGGSDFNPLAASASFFAFVDNHGFGAVVLPHSAVGKARRHPMPAVRVGAEVRGLEWDPFCPNNLATGGADGAVKIWSIPTEGLSEDLATPLVSLSTSTDVGDGIPAIQAAPKGLAFHPCAPGLIATRGLRKISLFDLTRPQAPCLSIGGDGTFEGNTYDMQWSFAGDVLLTTDVTRALKLVDLRAGRVVAMADNIHGPGTTRVTWCDSSVYMLTTGLSKVSREREFAVWDARSMATPIGRTRVGGTSSGFLLPKLHFGLGLLTLCGRGDSSVRLYSLDYASGKTSAVSNTSVGGVARAYAFVPRESCDVMSCEVTRLLKLCDDGVQPVSVVIPRRDKMKFHQELFPPAPGGYPSITTPDWLNGYNVPPYLSALPPPQLKARTMITQPTPRAAASSPPTDGCDAPQAPITEPAATATVREGPAGSPASCPGREDAPSEAQQTSADEHTNVGEQKHLAVGASGAESAAPLEEPDPKGTSSGDARVGGEAQGVDLRREDSHVRPPAAPALSQSSSSTLGTKADDTKPKLRHVFGVETKGTKPVFNMSPLLTSLDGPIIAASSSFWAVPWVGGGGPVFVSPLSASGKVEPGCKLVNGHRAPVNSIAFSRFRPSLMATGSEDSTVKLWDLADNTYAERSLNAEDAVADLCFNSTAVRYVEFHPAAENLIMTTNAEHSLQICDVAAGGDVAALTVEIHTHTITSACFNGDGSLIATTSRDGLIRTLDPRAGLVVAEGKGHEGRKTQKVTWCWGSGGRELLATTGCAAAGHRQVCLWDPRNLSSPFSTKTVDSSNGLLLPSFCEATGMLLLAGRGGSGIKYYELLDSNGSESRCPSLNFCHEYKAAGAPLSGFALLPPQILDVPAVEVARGLRLTSNSVQSVSFLLPRSGELKNFFQDDVYRPVRSTHISLSSSEWLQGLNPADVAAESAHSLAPPGMVPLSERPAPLDKAVPKAVMFRQQMEQREKEEKDAAQMMHKMSKLANQNAVFNPNRSVGVVLGVDQPTIVDSDDGEWSD